VCRSATLPHGDSFQCQCPAAVTEQAWRQAIDDAGRFLAQWGKLADSFGWSPGDLVDVARDGRHGPCLVAQGQDCEHARARIPTHGQSGQSPSRRSWNAYGTSCDGFSLAASMKATDERPCLDHRHVAPRSGRADGKVRQGLRHGASEIGKLGRDFVGECRGRQKSRTRDIRWLELGCGMCGATS
jgi:hypothetical protein